MCRAEPPAEAIQASSRDLDELGEALAGWHADFRPLESSLQPSQVTVLRADGIQLALAEFSPHVLQEGDTPEESRTFGLTDSEFSFYDQTVDHTNLLVFHRSRELSCSSRPGFRGYGLTFSNTALEAAVERVGHAPEHDLLLDRTERILTPDPERLREMRLLVKGLLERAFEPEAGLLLRQADLPARLLGLTEQPEQTSRQQSPGVRTRIVRRAEEYLRENQGEPVAVSDLCRAAGVSERTLRYAFREHHGVSPKAFLKASRLVAVRRELRDADPAETRVSDVANRWGFWHMGQFAADYRQLFQELPSETLGIQRT